MHRRFPKQNARRPKARRACPRLEMLEDRTAPAVLVVTSTIDTTADDGQLTLREAIQAATTNTSVDGSPAGETTPDTIVFAAALQGQTITLGGTELLITGGGDLSIVGPGGITSGITVDANNASRVFNIPNTGSAVTLMNLTVANGDPGVNNGGGVLNAGPSTTLSNVTIRSSTALFGGGLFNSGTITVNGSRIIDNTANINGGGLTNDTGATMTSKDTYIARNQATAAGGLLNSGTLTLNRSTIAFNSSSRAGGGIVNASGAADVLTLTNVTIAFNTSDGIVVSGFGLGGGGGISTIAGTVTINNSTIVGNADTSNNAGASGGVAKTGGTLVVNNSIISQNFAGPAVATANENVNGGIDTANDNFINGNPHLGPLQDNGGPTPTLAPLPGSPVIDAGSNGFLPAGVSTDQRGFPRILNNTVDQGAVESFPGNTTLTLSVTQGGMAITGTSTARPLTLVATVTSSTTGIMPTGSVNFFRDPTPTDPTDDPILLNSTPIALDDTGVAVLPNVPLSATSALLARFVPSSPAFDPSTSETDTITATVRDTVGVYDPNGVYQLLNQNTTTTTGPDFSYSFGIPGDLPVVGNWTGDPSGVSLPGVVRDVNGFLQWTLADENPPVLPNLPDFRFGITDYAVFGFPQVAVAGDWDGDGTDGIGLYDPASGTWFLRNSPTGSGTSDFIFTFGGLGFLPVVGDWDGDGSDTIGVYQQATGQWLLRNSLSAGAADIMSTFGGQTDARPVAGDWDGDGTDGIGVFFPQVGGNAGFGGFLLRNSPTGTGAADVNGGNVILAGLDFWIPVGGNWGIAPTTTNPLLNPPPMMMPLMLGEGGVSGGQSISDMQLQTLVGGALDRLSSAGADPGVLNALVGTRFAVADLPGSTLGLADLANGRVLLDADAAGAGWYVDGTPWEDSEFAAGGVSGVDLLTAVLHEMGHVAGHGHDGDGLMAETLSAGVRHTDALDAVFSSTQAAPDAGMAALP
jgi:hypothetical protein